MSEKDFNSLDEKLNQGRDPLSAIALIGAAKEARANAHAPYSQFKVGAALLCRDGKIYTGCNVENMASPSGICAECAAVAKAVGAGEEEFKAIAIVGGMGGYSFCPPCGNCRQVLSEFCDRDFTVYVGTNGGYETYTLGELLPYHFRFDGD